MPDGMNWIKPQSFWHVRQRPSLDMVVCPDDFGMLIAPPLLRQWVLFAQTKPTDAMSSVGQTKRRKLNVFNGLPR
jgi:hypothetical protein